MSKSRGLVAALFLTGCLHPPAAPAVPLQAERGAPDDEAPDGGIPVRPYTSLPSQQFDPMGLYSVGLAVADINADGIPDIVVSSGTDQGLQQLMVYYGRAGSGPLRFHSRPDWISSDIDSNSNLAVGDLNGDGLLDVAVTTVGDDSGNGHAKVYFNRGGELEKQPSWVSEDHFSSFACALGDADGDGTLDLAVSVMAENGQSAGKQRIYFNRGGRLSPRPDWTSDTPYAAGAVMFADVYQDGFLDLVIGASQTRIYRGGLGTGGNARIPSTPGWSSVAGPGVPYVDVGPLGPGRQWGLVLGRNPFGCQRNCTAQQFEAYLPASGRNTPVWTAGAAGFGAAVRLSDVNGDGVLDLIAGSWGSAGSLPRGGPLRIYPGGSGFFGTSPIFTSQLASLGQSLAVADLLGRYTGAAVETDFTITAPRQAVITLPHQVIGKIEQVTRGGQVLRPGQYASLPGESWISFTPLLHAGETVRVCYTFPRLTDVVQANQDCSIGDFIYYNNALGTSSGPAKAQSPRLESSPAQERDSCSCISSPTCSAVTSSNRSSPGTPRP